MFKLEKINDFTVKPIKGMGNKEKPKNELFDNLKSNIVLIAGKNSGKTVTIYNILDNVVKKGMNVMLFSSTLHNDDTYKKIIKMLEKKKANVITYDHFLDHENETDHLKTLIDLLREESKENDPICIKKEINKKEIQICKFNDNEIVKDKEVIKEKKIPEYLPEYICVYDDLSNDMRANSVYQMMIKNRHFRIMNIISVHSINDLKPGSLGNVDYVLAFGNLPKDKILELQEKIGLTFKDDSKQNSVLWNAYEECTKEKYNFLYIDRKNGKLRCNFNKEIKL